jgi:hypothetical protein
VYGGEAFKYWLLRDSEPCSRDCHFGEIEVRTLTTTSLAASHLRDPGGSVGSRVTVQRVPFD